MERRLREPPAIVATAGVAVSAAAWCTADPSALLAPLLGRPLCREADGGECSTLFSPCPGGGDRSLYPPKEAAAASEEYGLPRAAAGRSERTQSRMRATEADTSKPSHCQAVADQSPSIVLK
jgi:hypothetical protein